MKKILSLVLVLTLVLGSLSFSFASTELTSGIEDKDVTRAVERLAAFGIVAGMEDGKYHPELEVTREQFAKLIVEATGLGSAAEAAKGRTQFSDVNATGWAAGYINIAAGQGIIKGMPDGTFRPSNKVTYAEAVTMLVRALGYKDEFLAGTWPGNYVAKAAELDITKGVSFTSSGYADRGAVAVMLNNTLDTDVIKIDTYEGSIIKYYESNKTLLEDKLSIDKVENIRLITTKRLDDSLDSDEIRLLVLKDDTKIDGKSYDKGDEVEVDVTEDINIEGLVGLEITGYFDDDLMIYSEIETPEGNYLRAIHYDDEGDGTLLSYQTFKYYDYDNSAKIYINNEDRTRDVEIKNNRALNLNNVLKEYDANFSYAYGTVILEKGKVTFADLSVFKTVAGIVQDVNTDKDVIQYIDTYTGADEEDLNLGDYDEYHVLALADASKMELKDINAGDRIYFYEDAKDDNIAYVLVDQKEPVKGTLTEVKVGTPDAGSVARGRLFVDGKAYSLANSWTYSLDNMDSFVGTDRFVDLKAKLDDVFDEKVTVYLDTKGRVAMMTTDVNETTDNYAVVLRAGSSVKDELKLWTELGETVTYEVDELKNGITMETIEPNDIIKYDINSDGTIDVLAVVYAGEDVERVVKDGNDAVVTGGLQKITTKSVQIGGKYYFNQNSSLYFDYSDYKKLGYKDDDDLDVVVWKDFADTTVDPAKVNVVLVTDGDSDDIQFMAFIDGYDTIASDDLYVGYLLKTQENKDNMTITVIEHGKGEVKYTISKTADKDSFRRNVERPIVYTLSGDGIKVKNPATTVEDGVEQVNGVVTKRNGNDLYVDVNGTETRYVMENNVVIWEADEEIGKYDLEKDYPVVMLVKDGKVAVIAWDYNYATDEEVAAAFDKSITNSKLTAETLTITDKAAVDKLEKAYNDLSTAQKALVKAESKAKLDALVAQMKLIVSGDAGKVITMSFNTNKLTVTNVVYNDSGKATDNEYIVKVTGDAVANAIYSKNTDTMSAKGDTLEFNFDDFPASGIYKFELLLKDTFKSVFSKEIFVTK